MDKKFALVAMFFPLVAFAIAGVAEARFRGSATLLRMSHPVLGIAAFTLSLSPEALFPLTPSSSATLSSIMTLVSAVIACSGSFIQFSRRSTAVWMAVGGLVLVVLWMANRVVV